MYIYIYIYIYIYDVLEKASIFAYSARKTVKNYFLCSLRSSSGLTKKPRLLECLLSVVMEK